MAVRTDQASNFDRQARRLEAGLPVRIRSVFRWLRQPSSRWVRIPAALLLILGGIFSFLPVFGLWMLPLGVLLIAQDIPFLRRPTARALAWGIDKVKRWKARRKAR